MVAEREEGDPRSLRTSRHRQPEYALVERLRSLEVSHLEDHMSKGLDLHHANSRTQLWSSLRRALGRSASWPSRMCWSEAPRRDARCIGTFRAGRPPEVR